MKLSGIQRLTLLDYPGRVACTLFTGGCNLRCPYCHNAALALPGRARDELDEGEVLAFLEKRRGVLDGVAVTGGEPLLHADLPAFLEKLKAMGYLVKLDTNGTRPRELAAIVEAGLADLVAMDVKGAPESYARCCGLAELDLGPVRESVALLLSGAVDYEFRTTAVKGLHTRADLREIGRWIAGARAYYIQGFVDSGDLINGACLSAFTRAELEGLLAEVLPNVPAAALRGV